MKNYIVSGIAALALILAGFGLTKPGQTIVQNLGSVAGPESFFPCERHNGIETCTDKMNLTVATTTICSIKSPSATSTLESGAVRLNTSSTSASVIIIAKGAKIGASTTPLSPALSVAANVQATLVASSTPAGSDTGAVAQIFAPNTYFNVTMSGGTGTFSPTGSCKATFEVI